MLVVIEAERHSQGAMLSLRGRRPDPVQVRLVRVHPHQAGEELQGGRGIPFNCLESDAVGHEGRRDISGSLSGRGCSESARSNSEKGVPGRGAAIIISERVVFEYLEDFAEINGHQSYKARARMR